MASEHPKLAVCQTPPNVAHESAGDKHSSEGVVDLPARHQVKHRRAFGSEVGDDFRLLQFLPTGGGELEALPNLNVRRWAFGVYHYDLLYKIESLHDHKGGLEVTWRDMPTPA